MQVFGVQPQLPMLSHVHEAPCPQSVGKVGPPESPASSATAASASMQRKVQKCVFGFPRLEQRWAWGNDVQSENPLQNAPTPSELPC